MKWSKDFIRTLLTAVGMVFVALGVVGHEEVAGLVEAAVAVAGGITVIYQFVRSLLSPADDDPPPIPQ